MRNSDFAESGFTVRTDFVVARLSFINSGPSSNNQFRFQTSVGQTNKFESIFNVFVPISFICTLPER
jgi:hypothetical protein